MKQGLIFWFTGLSGSGKTTVALGVKALLEADGYSVKVFDGDDIRRRMHSHLGFTEQDIKKNNTLIAKLCQTQRRDYNVIMVSIISPYLTSRRQARVLIGKGFYEIYFSADLQAVIERDVKSLYSKAARKQIDNLIGYSPGSVYEPPDAPDFVVNSREESVQESINRFYSFVNQRLDNYGSK